MLFKEVSLILADTKDSYSSNPYELFKLLIGYTCGFDPNTEFSYPFTVWNVSKYGVFSGPYSVWMWENTDKKKLRFWTLFTRCLVKCSLCREITLQNHNNTVAYYNKKQKYQARKRLNNVLTTSRHHFGLKWYVTLFSRVTDCFFSLQGKLHKQCQLM